jgi:hypothetical protein
MDGNEKDFLKKNLIKLISLWKTSGVPKLFHTWAGFCRGKTDLGRATQWKTRPARKTNASCLRTPQYAV